MHELFIGVSWLNMQQDHVAQQQTICMKIAKTIHQNSYHPKWDNRCKIIRSIHVHFFFVTHKGNKQIFVRVEVSDEDGVVSVALYAIKAYENDFNSNKEIENQKS